MACENILISRSTMEKNFKMLEKEAGTFDHIANLLLG
jgi:hypothetical protein